MSGVVFAIQSVQGAVTASVVGNLGAPLRTGEFSEPNDDSEEIHLSNDPFNFGLALEDEGGQRNNEPASLPQVYGSMH